MAKTIKKEKVKKETTLIQQLEKATLAYLANCHDEKTPKICAYISSSEGKRMIVENVVNRVAKDGTTIAEAVLQLEMEYNQNRIED